MAEQTCVKEQGQKLRPHREDWKHDLLKAANYLSNVYFLLVREDWTGMS